MMKGRLLPVVGVVFIGCISPGGPRDAPHAWVVAGMPGEQHEILNDLVGAWSGTVKVWSEHLKEPQITKARCLNRWILADRYLETEYEGELAPGVILRARSLTGYDNESRRHFSVWIDSVSTSLWLEYGEYDPASKTLTYRASQNDARLNRGSTVCIVNRDKHVLTTWVGQGKNRRKVMEVVYERIPWPGHPETSGPSRIGGEQRR